MKKFIYTIFAICFTLTITAQISFQRLYDVVQDSTHRLTDGIVTNGGGYATLGQSVFVNAGNNDQENSYRAMFTTYDGKGSLVLQKDIYLADSTTLRSTSDLVQLVNGSYVMTASLLTDDQSAAIVALDANGLAIWSKTVSDQEELSKISLTSCLGDDVLIGTVTEDTSIWLSQMSGIDGSASWSKKYNSVNEDDDEMSAYIYDMHTSLVDSNVFITGRSIAGGLEGFHITKFDTLGAVLWSTHSDFNGFKFTPYGLTESLDSSVYVIGKINQDNSTIDNSFVSKFTKDGLFIWTKSLSGAGSGSTIGVDIIPYGSNLAFSNLGISGNIEVAKSTLFVIDSSGTIVKSQVYRDSSSLYSPLGNLHPTVDGGVVRFGTHIVPSVSQVSDIIKTDENLETSCSSSASGILIDFPTLSQSLTWTSVDLNDSDTLETDINNINYYDVPTISPSSMPWCPNETIIDTLDATPSPLPDGVITYAWMGPGVEGNTDSFVVGMEEGEYMVTVTINDKHCYTLCDTVNIMRLAEPTVDILPDFSQFCVDGTVNLIAEPNGVDPLESLIWNTNETDPFINVDVEGTYSVTLVDACMETATASIDVVFPEQLESLEVVTLVGEDCENFTATHTALSNVDNNVETTYSWSNGANTRIIEVDDTETYTVTVTYCGVTLQATGMAQPSADDNDLRWPKVFFPRGQEDLNKNFGPYNICNAEVTNYTLKIYNRWGNEVFTSDDIDTEWNGQHGGSDSATAVYVYVAEYSINGEAVIKKGDVTLLR